ncbi:Gypsy retrotransposon integrase-like protein 1 [Massospora cicadina]|nr:Gypsy retrotransposon integrase-like protein 1 [Massospora cicadina]
MCAYSPYFSLLCTKNRPAGKSFSERATHLFLSQLDKAPMPSTIQSGLLLGTYRFAVGNGEMAMYFLSITHRASQYIGLNFVDSAMFCNPVNPRHLSREELRCRRRIWWDCMATDVVSATLFGRPLGIDDRDFVVDFPNNDMEWVGFPDQYYFRRLLSALICAWRGVFRFTQHRHLRKWFRNDVITTAITNLEKPLLEYAQHLPIHMEYRPRPATVSPAHHCNTAVLHCVYWLIMILLHRSHIAHGISNKALSSSELHSKKQCIDAAYQIVSVVQDFELQDDGLLDIFSSFAAFNAATIFVNIAYTANIASATQAQHHLRTLRQFLRQASRVWAMNNMFIEILRLMEQLFRRRDPPASRDSSSIDWLVPTSTSYFQWYFANVSPA